MSRLKILSFRGCIGEHHPFPDLSHDYVLQPLEFEIETPAWSGRLIVWGEPTSIVPNCIPAPLAAMMQKQALQGFQCAETQPRHLEHQD
ncbi:hypothetical protein A9D60_09420 [Leisingera sp. JC1]|nr:hypothetical protein A9D60_09420 [Leisingera sp. JC1]